VKPCDWGTYQCLFCAMMTVCNEELTPSRFV
jgi:hypothetical protein